MTRLDQCAVCGKPLPRPETRFVIEIRGYAWPELPEFSAADLAADLEAAMHALVGRISRAGPEELGELEDEVFCRRVFTACRECYRRFIAHPVPEKEDLYPEDASWA